VKYTGGDNSAGFWAFADGAPANSAAINPAPELRRKSRRVTPEFGEDFRFFMAPSRHEAVGTTAPFQTALRAAKHSYGA
jgi:hypothetical protein